MATKINTNQIIDIETYVDDKNNIVLSLAASNAIVEANKAELNAKTYTDNEITTVNQTITDNGSNTLVEAKTYSDTVSNNAETNANAYTDNKLDLEYDTTTVIDTKLSDLDLLLTDRMVVKDSTVITTANSNAQYWDSLILQQAKDYTDINGGSGSGVDLSDYAKIVDVDTKDTDTLTSANNYTDTQIANIPVADVSWGNITGTLANQTDLQTALDNKQSNLTFETIPVNGSTNPVESNGIYDADRAIFHEAESYTNNALTNYYTSDESDALLDDKQDVLTIETTPTDGSTNIVDSNGIYDADQAILNAAKSYTDLQAIQNLYRKDDNLIPDTDVAYNIGSSNLRFKYIYSNRLYTSLSFSDGIYTDNLHSNTGDILVSNNLTPTSNNTKNLGSSTNNWSYGHISRLLTTTDSYIDILNKTNTQADIAKLSGSNFVTYVIETDTADSDPVLLLQNTATATSWSIRMDNSDNDILDFRYNNNSKLKLNSTDGTLYTNGDNVSDLGGSTHRWKDIYATNGTIQTSDRNLKKDIVNLDDNTVVYFMENLRPVQFKMIEGTRTHVGFIAQEVEDLQNNLGLDFAWLIKSKKYNEIKTIKTYEEEELSYDDNGEQVITMVEKQSEEITYEEVVGEYRYGLRYEEFIALQTRYSQILKNRLDSFEARLVALENKNV